MPIPKKIHSSVVRARIVAMCEDRRTTLSNPGLCLACGMEAAGVEPDAEEYECEECGESAVYGCEDLLIRCVP